MIEQFETKGKWKLPESEAWYNGTLKFTPENGATLEIFGSFNSGVLNQKTKTIILGETSQGNVTLVDNYYKSSNHSFESEITIETYKPGFIIVGHHFLSVESIQFRTIKFKTFNLFEWISTTGQNNKLNRTSLSINYNKPENISFDYFDGCKGVVEFGYSISRERLANKFEFEEECSVTFKYSEKRYFKDILMDVYIFNGFITLATFEQSYPLSIIFSDPEYTKDDKPQLIKCTYFNTTYRQEYKQRIKGEFLFDYSKDDFPDLIKNWYKRFQEIRPAFSLMLYSFKDKLKFNEDNFMDIARAVETFHRRTTDCTKMPKDEYEAMVQRIYDKVNPTDKQWLIKQDALKYQNELSLKNRLIDLFKTYSSPYLVEQIPNIKKFCVKVVDSRNYYTHFNADKEKDSLKENKLFELSQNLKALLITCLCKHIGLNENALDKGLKRNL